MLRFCIFLESGSIFFLNIVQINAHIFHFISHFFRTLVITFTNYSFQIKKNKKTVKLFWKEVRDDPISQAKLKSGYIWDELNPVIVDTQKLEHLFESRAKDLISKVSI